MKKVKRLYIYNRKVFFTYRTEYYAFVNDAIDNKPWHYQGEWAITIGIGDEWFSKQDWYYDGHTMKSVTIFGIEVALMYMYQSEELK